MCRRAATSRWCIYFHGNGGSLRLRVDRFAQARRRRVSGCSALSYRGYGGSTGKPTEAGLIEDARAAYAFAAERYPGRIALWGESLGTGVADRARGREAGRAASFSMRRLPRRLDVAAANYWFLPVRLLMKDQFRSDLRIAQREGAGADPAWRGRRHHPDRATASGSTP